MARSRSRFALLAVAAVCAACGGSPSAPSQSGPLRLTVEPLQTLVGSESTADFALKLQNTGSTPVTLAFPSSCQVMPYIVERASGRIVAPAGGGWVCATVLTSLTVAAGETHVETVHVAAARPVDAVMINVPPGDYSIYAKLEDSTYKLQSASLPFSVR